jgi:hypothetical protein
MSGNDKQKLSETFAKPASYSGTDEEYNKAVSDLADAFRFGIDGDSYRGFQPGGIYHPIEPAHVKRAVEIKYGPK